MQSYVEFAKNGRTAWYYYIGTVALVGLGYVVGQMPLMGVLSVMEGVDQEAVRAFQETLDFSIVGLDSVYGVYLMMLTYFGALAALWIGLHWLHNRTIWSLTGDRGLPLVRNILWALVIWLLLSLAVESTLYLIEPENYKYVGMNGRWWSMILLAIVFIPVQTSFEELFFRGYLLQGIGYAFKNPWIGAVVSSLLFAGMHSFNPEIDQFGYWTMMGYYFIAGFFLAILTIYSNSLALAIGVHAGTNVFSGLVAGYEGGVFKLPTLYKVMDVHVPLMMVSLILMSVIFILIARRVHPWGVVPVTNDPNVLNID